MPQREVSNQIINVDSAKLPCHVAIIMDGNGRWAQARGMSRTHGHRRGAEIVRPIVTECAELNLDALTLYSFSTENWTREQTEVNFLMELYVEYLLAERQTMLDNNVQFRQLGRREGLPNSVLDELDRTVELTSKNTGMTLSLALNYGSRAEIVDAVRDIAQQVQQGDIKAADIDEALIASHLYTAGLPDPDLLIRTAGEMRISNYLLWQISYAELYIADCCWPEFDLAELYKAFDAYTNRQRKFGSVPTT
ncbi:Decaprenyl diphosphate synthase-like protein [Poriferisphaera corsica]|uniref:Isoprenyl transferase n=1 Tax=Poriferisphaera corsica TaxID=2528020 RepID=A0A517YX39_9BACT|nr:isoprenyl transferase [Poriferisphaera corsica]QDU34782.1 Decaprenyl diphosphate synthase-like protein [Poriferisphaera corsica]